MKKTLSILFVVVCLLILVGCNINHEHTYGDYLVYESGHYHPYTCGCPQSEILEAHIDFDTNGICDMCEYTMFETTQVAKIVIDYEQKEQEKIDELKKTEPEMIYYFNPVDRVVCTFVFEDSDSVNRIIEEYDVYNIFKDSDINNFDSIKMLMIVFERDNFTESIYQKINQIKDNETAIKELYINFESAYIESYMPDINYYIDEKVELNYEIEKRLFNLTWEKGFIIKSKEEYDAYLDYLLEIEDFEPIRENINSKRDLYDETFFEENALIISSLITRGSGSIKLTLDNLYTSKDKVYIVIRTDEPEMGTADIKEATFSFIVKQSDILNVNEVITLG